MTFLPLDHLIFGNGRGFASPHHPQRFYCLAGELYTFMHGHGAQLHSVQWTHPRPQERRLLGGYTFKPLSSTRRWGRVWVSWTWRDLPGTIDEANAALREMRDNLCNPLRVSSGVTFRR